MAQITVDTDPVKLDSAAYPDLVATGQTMVIQNLGSGDLYVDFLEDETDLTISNGVKLTPGTIWEIQNYTSKRPIAMVSNSSADVRLTALN